MSSNGIREVIIEEALKLLPLVYHSFRNLLEGLNEEQVVLLWFLRPHKDDYYLRSKLYEELGFVTKEERKRISGLLTVLRKKKGYIEVKRNRHAEDKITTEGIKCLSRILDNIKTFSKTLSLEIFNSIEKKQDREQLIDVLIKFVNKMQRNPGFLSSAIIRAREKL
ncbi:hypothetical protein ES702_02114 [subsurface metagenome]